jgi:hypothetical protein
MEEHPEDEMLVIEGCRHQFCRFGVRDYVVTKLKEGSFPIPCPICASENREEDVGFVTEELIHMAGISEEDYRLWTTLQMAPISITIQCPKCRGTSSVDQEDYLAVDHIQCPIRTCDAHWCKKCSNLIEGANPEGHSCDGSKEFDALMSSQGWKLCPGCKTAISKEYGCNHMTCRTPGCGAHFCYVCGGTMPQYGRIPAAAQSAPKCRGCGL